MPKSFTYALVNIKTREVTTLCIVHGDIEAGFQPARQARDMLGSYSEDLRMFVMLADEPAWES